MTHHQPLRTASVSLLLLVSALASGCGPRPSPTTALTYGLTLAPTGIDPHLNASAELGIPLSSVYDTLVFQDAETGEFVPGLAERWTISPDVQTYTFYLRHDVYFHDGTPFNAEAVRANLDYTLNPDHHSQKAASMLGPLESVEVVDEFTVSFHLAEPFAPLLDSLSQVYLGMASPQALETWGPSDYQFHQVGTGPYRFVEYVPNDHLTLERNPDYAWAPSVYHQARAGIDRITFLFYVDVPSRALALENGEAQIVGEIPPLDASRLAAAGFQLLPVPISGQPMQLLFNTRLFPTDQLAVRQALILGIDRQAIVETVFGDYSPVAQGPLSASTLGYAPEAAFPSYDPQAAREALRSAGWVDVDGDGVRSLDGEPLALHIVVPTWGSSPEVAQLVAAAWENLGADVTISTAASFGILKEAQAGGQYNAIALNFFGTDPDLLRSFYTSNGLYNWTGIQDPEIDRLLLDASRLTSDPEARLERYADFARRVRDQALLLPIRDYVNLVVADSHVEGLRFSPQGWFPYLIDLRLAP
ncbi:MAG: ABC transporter substrate-binding protein [Chloroflexota bacterium]